MNFISSLIGKSGIQSDTNNTKANAKKQIQIHKKHVVQQVT